MKRASVEWVSAVCGLALAGCCFGQEQQEREEDAARYPQRAKAMAFARNIILNEGKPLVLVDKQSRLKPEVVEKVRCQIRDILLTQVTTVKDAAPLTGAPTAFAEAYATKAATNGLAVCLFLVEVPEAEHPAMTLSLDRGWVIVNVSALGKGNASMLAGRAGKEAARGGAALFGAGFSFTMPSVMQPARTLAELDELSALIDLDSFKAMGYWANKIGVTLSPAKLYRYKAMKLGVVPPVDPEQWAKWQEKYKKDPREIFKSLGIDPDALAKESVGAKKEYQEELKKFEALHRQQAAPANAKK